jgi:hypothetical protein
LRKAGSVATVRVAEEGGTDASNSWLIGEFRIERLHGYRFEEMPKSSHLVLSSGLRAVSEEGVVLSPPPLQAAGPARRKSPDFVCNLVTFFQWTES